MLSRSSTIFDCLIYKGYGHRVASRDHFPHPDAPFALDLGSKDVQLVHKAAAAARCPMPLASLLRDRFVASQNVGRGTLDWSAVALKTSEEAGSRQAGEVGEELWRFHGFASFFCGFSRIFMDFR